jgi:hypothetical protein
LKTEGGPPFRGREAEGYEERRETRRYYNKKGRRPTK